MHTYIHTYIHCEPRHGADGGHEGGEDERSRIGDIVFIEDPKRPWPYRVYRIGYGFYEGEVRIARLEEDTNIFENGMWYCARHCLKLEVYGFIDVCFGGFREAFEGAREITPGTRCQFLGFDADGDVLLKIGLSFSIWI